MTIKQYRLIYLENGLKVCLYCNQSVDKDLQLDHLFSWSRFLVNGFWNLYPVCSSCKSKKSDKIPIITKSIENRIMKHIELCMQINDKGQAMILNDLNVLYQRRFKSSPRKIPKDRMIEEIVEYIRSLSNNLLDTVPGYEFQN